MYRGAEKLDVVHRQQLGDGEGGDSGHEHHHHAAHDARHGEGQYHLAEYARGGSPQVLRRLNQVVVHLLKCVVNGVYHEWQEVVDHAEHQCSFAQR